MNAIHAMPQRFDGAWELLATAAGAESSIAKTMRGIELEALERGKAGPAIGPHLVRDRVEALAAWDPKLLKPLTERWKSPREIAGEPFWKSAWTTALRHLKALDAIGKEDVSVPELMGEVRLLWNENVWPQVSWREIAEQSHNSVSTYGVLRDQSRAPLREQSLSAAEVEEGSPLMLRLLRGRTHVLDESARAYVASMGQTFLSYDPFEAAVILETCKELQAPVLEEAVQQYNELISKLPDPSSWVQPGYVLVDRGWRVP